MMITYISHQAFGKEKEKKALCQYSLDDGLIITESRYWQVNNKNKTKKEEEEEEEKSGDCASHSFKCLNGRLRRWLKICVQQTRASDEHFVRKKSEMIGQSLNRKKKHDYTGWQLERRRKRKWWAGLLLLEIGQSSVTHLALSAFDIFVVGSTECV